MSKIKVIVSDLGNVLIPFDYAPLLKKLDSYKTGLGEKFGKLYMENYEVHRSFEKGKLPEDDFLKIMMEWTENLVSRKDFVEIYSKIFTENKKVTSLLPKLKKNYQLVLLSNTNSIHQKYGWENYDFLKHFDKLILSHEVGFAKPEEGIYKAVEEFTKLPGEAHLFIDDIEEYVDAAKSLGWEGIVFKDAESLKRSLIGKGIIF